MEYEGTLLEQEIAARLFDENYDPPLDWLDRVIAAYWPD